MTGGDLAQLSSADWIHRISHAAEPAGHRLVFCPSAGSSASSGQPLVQVVPAGWSVWAVQYPGRGPRLGEPSATSIRQIATACLPAIRDAEGPSVLFGHSFGAYVAYDLAQLLERQGRPAAGLLVSGIPAPGSGLRTMSAAELSDDSLIQTMRLQGGTSPELLVSEELMELVLPPLRADLSLPRSYQDDHGRLLETPTAALGGRRDELVSPEQMLGWRTLTSSWLGLELCEGDHFFYLERPSVLTEVLDRYWMMRQGGAA